MKLMRIYTSLTLGLFVVIASTHCGRSSNPTRPVFSASLPAGTEAPVTSDIGGVVTASFSPNAGKAQLLKGSASSNIAGASVAFPIGSLSIATEITMREGASLDGELLTGQLALNAAKVASSGSAIEITSTKAIDLKLPMIIALPLPTGFNLAVDGESLKKLGVVYRIQSQASGENIIGFVPATELTFNKDGDILYPSKFFGWFQVVAFDREVLATQKLASISLHEGVEIILVNMVIPSCGKADLGRTIYVQEDAQFQYCSAEGWKVIDLKGATGATGPTGSTGGVGPTGSPGSPGADYGMYLWDATPTKVGLFLSLSGPNALVKVGATGATLGFMGIGLNSGTLNPSCASGSCSSTTYFKSLSCAGAPYLVNKPVKNGVVVSGTSTFFKSTGSEVATAYGPFLSNMTDSSCTNATVTSFTTFPITTSYPMPLGQALPTYAVPLYVGP